jgi:formylglycine-generating enzyme required for sulfatase activity
LGKYEELNLVKIPAGEFLMGSSDEDKDARDDEKPRHTLFLPTYYIGKYPVTADEYREFVQVSGYKPEYFGEISKLTGNHPVTWLYWKDALAYAQWKGLTLPSEAEWEKAASWDEAKKEKRIYPWGNDWRDGYANTEEHWKRPQSLWDRLRRRKDQKTTTPVNAFPQGNSPYGCADMSGNVWEWCHSLYKPYPYDANDGREDENASGSRVIRGGSYYFDKSLSRCARRRGYYLDHSDHLGFRVCASPVSPERLLNSDS